VSMCVRVRVVCVRVRVSVCACQCVYLFVCVCVCVCVNRQNRRIYGYTIIFFFKVTENNNTIWSYRHFPILYARVCVYAILCKTSFNWRVGAPSAPKLGQLDHFQATARKHLLMTDLGGVQRIVTLMLFRSSYDVFRCSI